MNELLKSVINNLSEKDLELGCKDRLLKGVNKLAEYVRVTLGSKGKNVMFNKFEKPKITKDGVTVCRQVKSIDTVENMAIDVVREAAENTVKSSGDGTTTTILLAEYIILAGMVALQKGVSYYELSRQLEEATQFVINSFKENSLSIEDNFDKLLNVATISANDEQIGQLIFDIIKQISIYGHIEVKKSENITDIIETANGIQIHKGFYAPHFVSDTTKMKWHVQDGAYIVIFEGTLRAMTDLTPFIYAVNGKKDEHGELVTNEQGHVLTDKNHPILFLVDEVEPVLLNTLIRNKISSNIFNIMIVQHDGFGDRKLEIMNDIAALTGAEISDKNYKGDVGYCEEILVTEDRTSILGGAKEEDVVKDLVIETKEALTNPEIVDKDKVYYRRRLATLLGGVSVIHVGGITEVNRDERKDRIDDAVEAVRAAINRGISIGGGYSHLVAKEKLNSKLDTKGAEIISTALLQPFKQLCKNSDANYEDTLKSLIDDKNKGFDVITNSLVDLKDYKVYDSTGVLIDALQNALSVAKSILSTERVIEKNKGNVGDFSSFKG